MEGGHWLNRGNVMADITGLFVLLAILHGNGDSFSITELATYQSQTACESAAGLVDKGLEQGTRTVEVGCLPMTAINGLKQH